MHRTAKNLEIVEVDAYGYFTFCSYLLLHKTLIIQTKCNLLNIKTDYICFKILKIKKNIRHIQNIYDGMQYAHFLSIPQKIVKDTV